VFLASGRQIELFPRRRKPFPADSWAENTRHSSAHPCKMCSFNRRPIMPPMNILNTVEREAFESPPVFNSVQRKQYFDFPIELRRLAGELRARTHQLGFLLSAGYFKAAKSFFPPSAFHRRDLEYVARQLVSERRPA
jgi:hypothetical protein